MAASDFFPVRSLDGANPLEPYGRSRLAVGTVHVVAGAFTAVSLYPEVRSLFAAIAYGSLSLQPAFDGVRAIVGAVLCVRGARMMSQGIGGVTRMVIPSTAPAELTVKEAEGALMRRELGAFRAEPGLALRTLRSWFPTHLTLLTPRLRTVLDAGLAELGRFGRIALILAAAFVALHTFPSLNRTLFAGALPSVPWSFVAVFGGAAALHAWLVMRALPREAARTEVREFRCAVRGGGDPSLLAHGLQQALAAIRVSDALPNRGRESGFALQQGGVRDAGAFEGRLLIETQPRFTAMADAPSARPLLAAGSIVQLLALFWWLGVPETPATLITGMNAGFATSLVYGGQLVGASLLGRIGARMVASGAELLRRFRFESLAVVLDVRGTFARSHLRVGKGMYDSIETDNLVVRSDVCVSGWCAALLTESREPLDERYVVGMLANERAAEVELLVQRFLWRFERQPATIAAVNLNDAGLLEVVHANLRVEQERGLAQGRGHAERADPPRIADAAVAADDLMRLEGPHYPEG